MSDIHNQNNMDKQKNKDKSEVALREEEILAFWKENNIFNKTVETPAGKKPEGDFVFYDGPPFATGTPHYGHILVGIVKDAIPRFWTMKGKRVVRRWGWDCHGLPLENIIEKRLGLATKRDIEEMGVKKFNETAREAVMEYADDWKKIVPRMGRFVDMDDDYRTMDSTYTESVWWVFSELNRKGLVYEGFKSMHLCPRCGTTLSNFEVNQGYKDIKDIAVFVRLKLVDEENTSLLVWTTTPWTLPGNMAAAVHEDTVYSVVEVKDEENDNTEKLILAKERVGDVIGEVSYEVKKEIKGSELVGRSYIPPFDFWQKKDFEGKENAWKIYHADYVEVGEEGTGAVHLAPAYGEEDMELAKENEIPIVHHVDEDGRFMDFVTDFSGQLVKPKDDDSTEVTHLDADIEVLKKLKDRNVLFKKEKITHSYPHCWRCDTPLLNYGTTSWFVSVTDLKDKLIKENNKIKWVPEHVGKNRFGKWLDGARDWAISRQRYWGAPLPIWKIEGTNEHKIFGSKDELLEYVPKSGNTYHLMRHGLSVKNVDPQVVTDDPDAPYPLTDQGKKDVKKTAKKLKGKIDLIITSPVLRARETAEILSSEWGFEENQVIEDDRIRETNHGVFEGKPLGEFFDAFPWNIERFENKPERGENWSEIKKRTGDFIYDIENKYKDKNILIVSHGVPLTMLRASMEGLNRQEVLESWEDIYPKEKGVAFETPFTPLPHNGEYEFDFHRPYIDELELMDEEGRKMLRIPDVFDCWFESGSMPYGQHHYPFENKDTFKKNKYPAQFISEALDQTRGWFYSLLVLGTALFGKSPYEKVIVTGLVMAEDGKKMSKKLQNYPDPMELADRVGVDAMRFYLISSPLVKGEDLNFIEKEVLEIQRKNIGRLHNVLAMYEMFAGEEIVSNDSSEHVLDRWIISRLNQTTESITDGYEKYELEKATRPLIDLIDDLSVWYLRRSRDRLKGKDEEDKRASLETLKHVLKTLSLLMSPVMPFYAEYLFQRVNDKEDAESVHLMPWPESSKVDKEVLIDMEDVRNIVSEALEIRSKEGIKVRQPLSKLYIAKREEIKQEYALIIMDEVNVKEVLLDDKKEKMELDLEITPDLKKEGDVRELIRGIQSARKEKGLSPQDNISLLVDPKTMELISGFEQTIKDVVGSTEIIESDNTESSLEVDGHTFSFTIKL